MTTYEMLPIVVALFLIAYIIFAFVGSFMAHKDFKSRKFSTLKEKNKWRTRVYIRPFGYIHYLFTFVLKAKA